MYPQDPLSCVCPRHSCSKQKQEVLLLLVVSSVKQARRNALCFCKSKMFRCKVSQASRELWDVLAGQYLLFLGFPLPQKAISCASPCFALENALLLRFLWATQCFVCLLFLLNPCFKTALCYGVVSGCFVPGVSPSSRFRPELAPKRGPAAPKLAFRTPESAKSMQKLLGHNAAWQGRSCRLGLWKIRRNGANAVK